MGNEAGNAVLLNDDVFVMHGDDLLDLDVLMAWLEDEACAVSTDPLVLRKSQAEPLETTGGRTLTNKLVRRFTAQRPRDPDDVLVQLAEQSLVLGQTLVARFTHGADSSASIPLKTPGRSES